MGLVVGGAVVALRWGRTGAGSRDAAGPWPAPLADREAEAVLLQALHELGRPVTLTGLLRHVNPSPAPDDLDAWRDQELRLVGAFQRLHRFRSLERCEPADRDGEHRYVLTRLGAHSLRTGETPRL